ncbi:MAG: SNF2-related protein [Devosia sp.]
MISFETHFDQKTLERGRAYQRAGHVVSVVSDKDGTLEARVNNGKGQTYRLSIQLQPATARKPDGEVFGLCSCPVSFNCKHVVASVLDHFAKGATSGRSLPATVPAAVQFWLRRLQGRPVLPAQDVVSDGGERPADYPNSVKDRLLYVADISQVELRIDIHKGRINAQGSGLNKVIRRYDVLFQLRGAKAPPAFFRPIDIDLLGRLARSQRLTSQSGYGTSNIPDVLRSGDGPDTTLLRTLCDTRRALVEANPEAQLAWSQEIVPLNLGWSLGADGGSRLAFVAPDGSALHVGRFGQSGIWLDTAKKTIGELTTSPEADLIEMVRSCPVIAGDDLARLAALLPQQLGGLNLPQPKLPDATRRPARTRHARLTLSAGSAHEGMYGYGRISVTLPCLSLRFVYDGHSVALTQAGEPRFTEGNTIVILERDHEWENACHDLVQEAGAIPIDELELHRPSDALAHQDFVFVDDEFNELILKPSRIGDALGFTGRVLPHLRAEGWDIEIGAKWPYQIADAQARLSVETRGAPGERFGGHGWFDLGFKVEIAGKTHDLAPLVAAFVEQLGDEFGDALPGIEELLTYLPAHPIFIEHMRGQFVPIDLSPIASVLQLFLLHHGAGWMHPSEAADAYEVAEALSGSGVPFADHAGILPLARSLQALGEISTIVPPQGLCAELRPYQGIGAAWMGTLIEAGFGGVLADDMGLGKTVQVLALLQARRENGKGHGPALLVVPTSLIHGWQEQARRFVPGMHLLILHGTGRHGLASDIENADLVVTTYPLLARDRELLSSVNWDLVIADEAQVLKNPASQMAKALRDIPAAGRLALTGTPMENSLQDLWTLFDWINPGLLGDRKTFQKLFRTPIEKHGDAHAQARLNRRVRPFLLRRTKEAVASELPPRTEILERIELSKSQQALYEAVRSTMDARVRDAIASRGLAAARITILDALLKLRQVCCDPGLVKSEAARDVSDSAKRTRLKELLEELVAEGRRVLIFSQFVEMLGLIASDLDAMGIAHLTLTGQTRNRADVLDEFRSGTAPVFLISLKAGGVGLTLTEADTVILYDPWWNPAVERQAMDRAHRIGQDKPVFVHRLVASGTVEEKILALQARKQAIADALLSDKADEGTAGLIDGEVLADLFAPLAE